MHIMCVLKSRERKYWENRSSSTFFGLHTFKVIERLIHWHLTLKETEREKQLLQAHIILYKSGIAVCRASNEGNIKEFEVLQCSKGQWKTFADIYNPQSE